MNCPSLALVLASTFVFATLAAAQGTSGSSGASAAAPATSPAGAVNLTAPLPSDGRLVTGVLDNGLRYFVMKNSNPPGRASLRLHISTGSLNETEQQRGIAHFLEHMAFNGSENFAPGTVINFFQSMGMQFGRDQNASTGFDRTMYMLDLPDVKPETLGKGTLFFADVASRLKLLPTEIDSERQIIMEEKRTRDSAQWRSLLHALPRMIPGSLYGERLPIGVEDTIKNMTPQDFQDYYRKWYVPSNMILAVVADADSAAIVELIKKDFSSGHKVAKPVDQDMKLTVTKGDSGIVFADKELTQAQVQIMRFDTPTGPVLTVGDARRDLVEAIANAAFGRSIEAKISAGKMTFLNGGASSGNQMGMFRQSGISASGKPEDWKKMLGEITTEVRRATLHGLSAKDVDAVKAEILSETEQAVKTESTASHAAILGRILSSAGDDEPVMSPEQNLELVKSLLLTITAEECSKRFAERFKLDSAVFMVTLPVKDGVEVPTEAEFAKLGREALSVTPAADSQTNSATDLLSKAPTAGTFAEINQHQASDVYGGWLANGVRFNYRFMDYKKNSASVSITVAGGTLHETKANRGISEVAGIALNKPATSTLSSTDIRDLLSGKQVDTRGGAGVDTFSINISGDPSALEDGFKVAHILLTDAKIEQAAFDQWKTRNLQVIESRKTNPTSAFAELAPSVIYSPDEIRTKPLTKEQIESVKIEDAQKWLRSQMTTGPIEVTVVGDIERTKAMDLVAKYLGSLPTRERISKTTFASERKTGKQAAVRVADKTMETATDQAVVAVGFDGPDLANMPDVRAMNMAVRVINTRMIEIVREKEQLVYSPRFTLNPATALPGTGTAIFFATTDPHKVDRLVEVLGDIFEEFSKGGPTEDELKTAHKQFAASLEKDMKEPNWWAGRLNNITYRGIELDDILSEAQGMEKLSASEVLATFNKYYKGKGSILKCIVRPTAAAAGKAVAPAGEKPRGVPDAVRGTEKK